MIPDVYRYNLPMFYQPPYLDTMPNGTLCGLLAQSVPEGPDVILLTFTWAATRIRMDLASS